MDVVRYYWDRNFLAENYYFGTSLFKIFLIFTKSNLCIVIDLSAYFQPVNVEGKYLGDGDFYTNIASATQIYANENLFPDLEGVSLALIGVCDENGSPQNQVCKDAPDEIRRFLYPLALPVDNMKMVDLGNIIAGNTPDDTRFAVTEVLYKLIEKNITVIFLGGSQDLSLANYKTYEVLGRVVNIASIDAMLDLCNDRAPLSNRNWISYIVAQQPNFLFNFANIGYQTYFNGNSLVKLMDELGFDAYRLGVIQADMVRDGKSRTSYLDQCK